MNSNIVKRTFKKKKLYYNYLFKYIEVHYKASKKASCSFLFSSS